MSSLEGPEAAFGDEEPGVTCGSVFDGDGVVVGGDSSCAAGTTPDKRVQSDAAAAAWQRGEISDVTCFDLKGASGKSRAADVPKR